MYILANYVFSVNLVVFYFVFFDLSCQKGCIKIQCSCNLFVLNDAGDVLNFVFSC